MRKRTRWVISATTTGSLLLTGALVASDRSGPAATRASLAAAAAPVPAINLDNCPTLAQGYQGGCVNQLQSELNTDDNAGLPVDGIFGPLTQQAVITFQQEHGVVPADGIVGPLTKQALDNAGPSVTTPQSGTPAPSAPPVNLDNCPVLSEGYQGDCVNQLQSELNTDDNAGLPVDGTFGPLTQQGVITFQQEHGVSPADGIVGPLTKKALDGISPATPATVTSPGTAVILDNCPTLAEGYQGGCVNELQSELNADDNAGLPVDGTFGPLTQQAVITFQQEHGVVPADGVVGPDTKKALDDANSVPTPQPGAPLTPLQICLAQGGLISDGHGGCTHDGAVAQGKSASDCIAEATTEEAQKLILEGVSPEAAAILVKEWVKRSLLAYDAGKAFYCILLANPGK